MTRGAFITLEGGEGVGKSTALAVVEHLVRARGQDPVVTREPGGTALGERVREWILEGEHGALSAQVEVLLMFAARAAHLDEIIRPALAAGRWVICDRFTDATLAYQGGGRGASESFLKTLAREVQSGLEPDLTLLLDAPVEVGFERIRNRSYDHFEREDPAFFSRVRERYLALAAEAPERIKVVNAAASLETVTAEIEAELETFCDEFDSGQAA